MKANVRFDDIFEGEDLPDIQQQVLEYLEQIVIYGDLEAFDITLENFGVSGKWREFRPEEWKSSVLNE